MTRRRILILSATASAINVIRSLRDSPDLQLFVADANGYAGGLYEPGLTPIVIPHTRDRDAYRASLDAIIADRNIDVLLPSSDRDVGAVVELYAAGWSPRVVAFQPSIESHQLLANKLTIAKLLMLHGLPVPRMWNNARAANYPAVVKPVSEGGGRGVSIVSDFQAAEHAIASCEVQYGPGVVLQEYIPGEVGSTYVALLLYGPHGESVAHATMRSSLTYYTWGGGGNAGYLVDEPELVELSRTIISLAGGWRGPINLEFRRHADTGKFYFIEVNCRLNGYSYLTTMNGMNFPRAMIDLLLDQHPARIGPGLKRSNFCLGFRERVVENWIACA